MKPAHSIILLVLNLFWATVYSAYKVIGQTLPCGGIVTLRFGLAALFFLVAWPWLPGRRPRGRDLVVTCVMGLIVFVLGQRLQVGGNQLGSAGNSAVLMALEPLVTFGGGSAFPARAYRSPAAGGVRFGAAGSRLAQPGLAGGFPMDGFGGERDLCFVVSV